MRRAVLVLSLLTALTVASATAAADTSRHPIAGAGASISVPGSWKTIDARTVTNSAAFARFVDENPSLRPFVAQMSGPNSAIKLMAFDLKLTNGYATNVNVVVTPASAQTTLKQIAAAYDQQLRSLVPSLQGGVATRIVSLPATKAVRASYRLGLTSGGRRVTVQSLQYVVLRGNRSIVITFSTLPGQASARRGTFDTIARSLRFA